MTKKKLSGIQKGIFDPLMVIAGYLVTVLAVPLLQPIRREFYLPGILLLIALASVLIIFSNRMAKGNQKSGSLGLNTWCYAILLAGVELLGGIGYGHNLAVLLFFTGIVAVLASPMRSMMSGMVLLAVFAGRAVLELRPVLLDVSSQTITIEQLFQKYSVPVISVLIIHSLMLALKQHSVNKQNSVFQIKQPTAPEEQTPKSASTPEKPSFPREEMPEDVPNSSTQYFTRAYLERQAAREREMMKGRLDEVVYFMNRNFKAFTALGFICDQEGDSFYINSVVTKSKYFNNEAVIKAGTGLVGSAVGKPNGFITGNISGYTDGVEYYNDRETIGSIMVQRIMDNQTNKIQGLLVVDSDRNRAFTDEHKELMNRFAHIASAIATATQINVLKNKQAAWADTQYEIAKQLSEVLKVDEIIDVLVINLCKIFEHDRLVVCSYNSRSRKGIVCRIEGRPGALKNGLEFNIHNRRGLYGTVFRNRREVMVQGFRNEDRFMRFDTEEERKLRPQDILIAPILDDREAVFGVVGVESDKGGVYSQEELRLLKAIMMNLKNVLTKARMYEEMEKRATIDGLTEIANHRKFQEVLETEMERAGRYDLPLTLLLMDIDFFKKFNDTHGHSVGDLVLKNVARSLENSIRTSDFCARYGGEEFVVLLIQTDETQSRMLSERIRQAVEKMEIEVDEKHLKVTLSIGSATFPKDGITKTDLIENADKALYLSKENGRNQVSFYSEMPKNTP